MPTQVHTLPTAMTVGVAGRSILPAAIVAVALLMDISGSAAQSSTTGAAIQEQIDELKKVIQKQEETIEKLQGALDELQQREAETRRAAEAADKKADAAAKATAAGKPVIRSGQPNVTLAISGQINRAINVAGDGRNTRAYFVDNDNSVSRIRFVGTGAVTEDVTIGTRIELGISPNNSTNVSQTDEDAGDTFDERIVEAYVDSRTYGRLLLGKGSTSSDHASEVDLSGTEVLAQAPVADIAGGLRFSEHGDGLTGITVSDGFTDYDGDREDRIRYDSPKFAGFWLSGSAFSDQRYDGALRWGGQDGRLKAAAAAALQDPNVPGTDVRYNGSFSVLHEPSGLNFTASAGGDKLEGKDPVNLYLKGGWMAEFFQFGTTNFSLDYTRSWDRVIDDAGVDRADGNSIGFAAVQNITDYGAEVYGGLRWYRLEPDSDLDLDEIVVGTMGTRVKF